MSPCAHVLFLFCFSFEFVVVYVVILCRSELRACFDLDELKSRWRLLVLNGDLSAPNKFYALVWLHRDGIL